MYVIVAEFTVVAERVGDFLDAIKINAGHSVAREPGCRQFDVCVGTERGELIYLYEVYDDDRRTDLCRGVPGNPQKT